MALEVGAAVLSSFLSVLFHRMASRPVLDFIRGHKVTAGLLHKLKMKLLSVNAVLDDAEGKQIRDPNVREWLDELKDAVHHAEDLLDEIKTEALRRKVEEKSGSSSTRQVHNITSPSLHELDKTLEPRILEILERLELIVREKDVLGLREDVKDSLHAFARLPTTSLPLGEDSVYGREKDKDNIIKLLLADDVTGNKISVIPIVGMGGIGKTTLAQLVYNNDRVRQHFHLRAWVCVSEEFDVVKITQTICGSVTSKTCDHITNLDRLQVNLKEALTGKKFLFVLDDVWKVNYSQLDLLNRPFENGSRGSKIIVTTRIDDVASMMGTLDQIHRLEQISEDDCWLIFAKHALENAGVNTHPDLEVVGRQIVRKCKGLPLAARSLGSLLRSKLDLEEWEKILKSEIWELSDMEILPALWLSYHYLPPHLKRCFMYCSIFPKNYVFEKSKLILLWMAEDLLQAKNKKMTMEETGEEYFNDLISRSFFQHANNPLSKSGFIMHDLVNDLANFLSGEFCVRLENKDDFVNNVSKTRHFSYMKGLDSDDSKKLEALYEAKNLHTFLPLPSLNVYGVVHDLLPALQYLRLINLSGYAIHELPNSIGSLKHLRYLDLSDSQIQKLPETMCTLYNLQTLLLDGCYGLAELPTNFGRLISIRHLNITTCPKLEKMPPHMGKLRDLQTLKGAFVLDKYTGRNIAELKELKSLRGQLYISGLHNIVRAEDALEANMRDKKYLNQLCLEWGGDTEDSKKDGEVLANLQPHTKLKILTIRSYGGTRFPGWLGDHSSSNLVSLKLVKCEYCFFLPPLGQLPSLRELEIIELNGVVSIGPEFYGDDTCGIRVPFRSLQLLKFESMREWQEWSYVGGNQEGGAFPNLCELELWDCPKLSGRFPLDYFPKLEKLRIRNANVESLATSSQCPKLLLSLSELYICYCPNFLCFPDGGLQAPNLTSIHISECKKLRSLPEEMHTLLPSLESMWIQDCPELESFPKGGLPLGQLPSLEKLQIVGLKEVVPIGPEFYSGGFPNLCELDLWNCPKLSGRFPLDNFPKLETLTISNANVESLATSQCPKLLLSLTLSGCPNLVCFPDGGLQAPNLTSIHISECKKLRSLPKEMHTLLPSLETMSIQDCPELESFPEGGLPSNLRSLSIIDCKKVIAKHMQWGLQRLTSLKHFSVGFKGCEEVDSFPEEGLLPTTLTILRIFDCLNLKTVNGKELRHLTFLQRLWIESCPELQCLPDEGLPTSLSRLRIIKCPKLQCLPDAGLPTSLSFLLIRDCPLLKQRCQRETGEDWPKIAHIPHIYIDR